MRHRDNGVTTIAWDVTTSSLPTNAPIVCFLHGVTGHSETMIPFLTYARSRGWRACVFNRRGHSHALMSARFNFIGDTEDTREMVSLVTKRYPDAFIGMVGLSAGSGQLVSYLGKTGVNSGVNAAACLGTGYDFDKAVRNLDAESPWLSRFLVRKCCALFLDPNEDILVNSHGRDAFDQLKKSKTFTEFMFNHFVFAGHPDGYESYMNDSNPIRFFVNPTQVVPGNRTPTLVLSSMDDPICVSKNIPFNRLSQMTKDAPYVVCVTEGGSHVCYAEGLCGRHSWMERLTMDWLDACMAEKKS